MDALLFAATAFAATRSNNAPRDANERICWVNENNNVADTKGALRGDMRKHNLWHRATYILVQHQPRNLDFQRDNTSDCERYDADVYVLVQKRSQLKDYCPGKYDPTPGGVVGVNETYLQNAQREIMEEMGIDVTSNNSNNNTLERLFTFSYQDDHVRVWGDFYICTYTGPMRDIVMQAEEVEDVYRWSLQQLRDRINSDPQDFMPDACHAIKLYLQRRHDISVNRRLLHGYSSSNLEQYDIRPQPRVLFFDCDDCLYFDNWKTAKTLSAKIDEWCQQHGLEKGYAYKLYKQYGTSIQGLLAEDYITNDPQAIDAYLQYVHDIPLTIPRNDELRNMLLAMDPSIPKYVFTASVRHHAQRCLEALGIADLFVDIVDCKDCDLETKHNHHSFMAAMKKVGNNNITPESCILFDDNTNNIRAAHNAGWRAVLVGKTGRDSGQAVLSEHAELEVDTILDVQRVLPELFK